MKGQIFSIDFVIAVAILTISIGLTIQALDNLQKRVQVVELSHTNNAETIAQSFVRNSSGFANATPFCYIYSNGTGNCGGFPACARSTFAATRLLKCLDSSGTGAYIACSIEVRTCE